MDIPAGLHQVQYGTTTIDYELVYAKRKTLAIHVYPDCSVVVKAPKGVQLPQVETSILKRAGWILRQQRKFEQYPVRHTLPRQYVSGEAYRYLGRQYRLKVIETEIEQVRLSRGFITVSVRNSADKMKIAHLLEKWFRSHAHRVFNERLAACFPRVESLGISYPELAIREMKSRWGSCSGNGKVTLNLKLIYVPKDLIDYVVIHELCHLKELNHSPAFYALLDRILPDWRERRDRLNHIELR